MTVVQHRDIRWIEMSPIFRPNLAFGHFGLVITIAQYATVGCNHWILSPGMICGHEQIVRW